MFCNVETCNMLWAALLSAVSYGLRRWQKTFLLAYGMAPLKDSADEAIEVTEMTQSVYCL